MLDKSGITIWYSVKDLENTLSFYVDLLGFEKVFHDPATGMAMVNTNTKDCIIGFSVADTVVPSTSSTVFEVQDIERTIRALGEKGIEFPGGVEFVPDMAKLATFYDPDGHNLMLSETLSEL